MEADPHIGWDALDPPGQLLKKARGPPESPQSSPILVAHDPLEQLPGAANGTRMSQKWEEVVVRAMFLLHRQFLGFKFSHPT